MIRTAIVAAAIALAPLCHTNTDVVAIDTDVASPEFSQALLDNGYRGIPGDGREAIYVPRDVARQMCYTDSDCELTN